MAMIRSSIGLYLRYSVVATAAVVVLPLVIAAGVTFSVRTGAPVLAALLVGAFLSVSAAILGSWLWKRRPESMDLSFGELMLWSFLRRRAAEEKLEDGAEVLGLDRGGRPLRRTQLSKEQRLKILRDLAHALETKDPYTHGHSTRVEELAAKTAAVMHLSDEEIDELRTAASLHDVGKIRIPTRILRKADHLTIDEQLIVQDHSAVGAWMVAGVSNGNIVTSVRHHHERWDGNGYPDGLSGRDIPLFARIIAVADAYDAMTSTRPYRPSMNRHEALAELEHQAGRQFDPAIVEAFIATAPRRVPLPAFVGLGLLERLVRKTAAWGARLGTGSVASGVASVGAASVLIGSLFAPPAALTSPTPSEHDTNAEIGESETGEDVASADEKVRGGGGKSTKKDKAFGARGRSKTRAEDPAAATEKSRTGGDGTTVMSDTLNRDFAGDDTSSANEENPPPDVGNNPPPGNEGNPEPPEPPEPPGPGHEPGTDPRPDVGRDCPPDHPEQADGPGTVKRCS